MGCTNRHPGSGLSAIDPFFQFLTRIEKGQLLRCDPKRLTRFGIRPGVGLVLFDKNGTASTNFDSTSFHQCIDYCVEKQVHHRFGLCSGTAIGGLQGLDQSEPVHALFFPEYLLGSGRGVMLMKNSL
jgi:hypothetical protein